MSLDFFKSPFLIDDIDLEQVVLRGNGWWEYDSRTELENEYKKKKFQLLISCSHY